MCVVSIESSLCQLSIDVKLDFVSRRVTENLTIEVGQVQRRLSSALFGRYTHTVS